MAFTIIQWNIKGYLNNYNELDLLIRDTHPNVICLQETHIPYNTKNIIIPKAYVGYFHNCVNNKNPKQGVAILIKHNIPHRIVSSTIQLISIEIKLTFPITIINTYIPPSQTFCEADICSLLSRSVSPPILLGDFNAWSPLWGSEKSNKRGTIVENVIFAENLIILNDGSPTHFSTHNTFTNIDLTLASAQLSPKCSWRTLSSLYGSDHFPLLSVIQTKLNPCHLTKSPNFNTDAANWDMYQTTCEKNFKNWNTSNVRQLAANITKAIRSSANVAIPQSKTTPLKIYAAWWNKNLSTLRAEKQKLWHIYKSSPSVPNLIAYKKDNAIFKKSVKAAKAESIGKFTEDINPSYSPKKNCSKIKALTGIPPTPIKVIQLSNQLFSSPLEIANIFGETWSNYAHDSNFHTEYINRKSTILSQSYNPSRVATDAPYLEKEFSYIELEHALQHSKGKTPGKDRISYPMLRHLPNRCKNILLVLYNKILESGTYPHTWLSATLLPIPKPNQAIDNINSYRPISLLSCLRKILEKMPTKRLMWFLTKNHLISHNQVAFKKNHNTLYALLLLQHFICDAISTKNHVSVLSTDFEKAFERVGAHVVLEQLASWEIGSRMYNLIKSFLSIRSFQAKVSGTYSETFPLANGIPHGSPLSVVLFKNST
ncbi:PREDICTED: RNA-directed DNA polymerase from mobile element jockey-like isoform X1 [Rhagoletis zephyria]|uniref:RNA-directed DNA polymerase from mobile element jockey-like isoform X1 n=1 Tax=Rhagoletis zephyria TaxID=28612 RepID=UPI000811A34D|nr:PREDICTED: RNA-directed DNA polymerase from mobile element jockey-like isoform X1 [Rhagoletis zephyria]